MRKKTRPLLIITWLDHTSNDDWTEPERLDDRSGSATIISVGWLMKRTKKAYILASTICTDDDHTGMTMTIIKGAIVRKVVAPNDLALKVLSEGKNEGIFGGANARIRKPKLSSVRSSSEETPQEGSPSVLASRK